MALEGRPPSSQVSCHGLCFPKVLFRGMKAHAGILRCVKHAHTASFVPHSKAVDRVVISTIL